MLGNLCHCGTYVRNRDALPKTLHVGRNAPCPARHVFDSRNMSAARQAPTASYEHEVPIDIFHLVDISSTRTGIVLRVKTSQTALEQTE